MAKNIYSNSDFWWIFGLLIGILHLMSMIIRELQEFVSFGLRGQKFIQQRIIIVPTDSTNCTKLFFLSPDEPDEPDGWNNELSG